MTDSDDPVVEITLPQVGDSVVVDIEGLGFSGEGYACPVPGRFISVWGTMVGERVRVEMGPWRGPRAWGELVDVLSSSPERLDPSCAAYRRCSGCSMRHLSREAERAFKVRSIAEIARRYGGVAFDTPLPEIGWVAAPGRDGHRVRGRFSVAVESGRVRIGLRSRGLQRSIVDVRGCPAQAPRFIEIIGILGFHLDDHPDVAQQIEELEITLGGGSSARVIAAGTPTAVDQIAHWVGELEGVDVGPTPLPLPHGVMAPASSWIHANPSLVGPMIDWVVAGLAQRDHQRVLDLCCGVGTVSSRLVDQYEVLAVDRDHHATAALQRAGLRNLTVRTGAIGRILRKLRRELSAEERPTAAVVNPMRRPLGAELDDLAPLGVEEVIFLGPSSVSATRDAERMARVGGFRVQDLAAIDLHPGTSQVMLALKLTAREG